LHEDDLKSAFADTRHTQDRTGIIAEQIFDFLIADDHDTEVLGLRGHRGHHRHSHEHRHSDGEVLADQTGERGSHTRTSRFTWADR